MNMIASLDSGRANKRTPDRAQVTDNTYKGRGCIGQHGSGDTAADSACASTTGDEIMTPEEVASYLRVSRSLVYKMLKRDEIPAYCVGSLLRVRKADLLASLREKPKGL